MQLERRRKREWRKYCYHYGKKWKNQEETVEKQLDMTESRKGQNSTINIQILIAVSHPEREVMVEEKSHL